MNIFLLNNFFKNLFKKVLTLITFNPKLNFVLAYSGGLDSTVLLDILSYLFYYNKINNLFTFNFRVLNINHNFNIYSNYWSLYCKNQCIKYGVVCDILSIFLNFNFSEGLESSLRKLRYKTLFFNLKYNEILLTGHHLNDQIETIFLSLKRGSKLFSINYKSIFYGYYKLFRPLLNVDKKILKIYACYYNIRWIEDFSNLFMRFDRNFIRSKILPIFKKRWPYYIKTIFRSFKYSYFQELLLNYSINNILISLINFDGSLELSFLNMSREKISYFLYRWFIISGLKNISNKYIKILLNNLISFKYNLDVFFKFNNYQIKLFNNKLYLLSNFFYILKNKEFLIEFFLSKRYYYFNYCLLFINKINIFNYFNKYKYFNINILNNICIFNIIKYKNNFCLYKNNFFFNFYINCFGLTLIRLPFSYEKIFIRYSSYTSCFNIINKKYHKNFFKAWREYNIFFCYRKIIPLLFYNHIFIAAIGLFITNEGKINFNLHKYLFIFWSAFYI